MAHGGDYADMVTLQLYSCPHEVCAAVDGVWFLLLDMCGWASAASPACCPLSVALSSLLFFPVAHLLVFLRWFPAGGWSRRVSVCTWVHQCPPLGTREPPRAGTHEPWGTPVFGNVCNSSHGRLQPRCFARKLARKLVM